MSTAAGSVSLVGRMLAEQRCSRKASHHVYQAVLSIEGVMRLVADHPFSPVRADKGSPERRFLHKLGLKYGLVVRNLVIVEHIDHNALSVSYCRMVWIGLWKAVKDQRHLSFGRKFCQCWQLPQSKTMAGTGGSIRASGHLEASGHELLSIYREVQLGDASGAKTSGRWA